MSYLNEISGFNSKMAYFEQNKNKPWQEWLKVKEIFRRPGKQGLVGLMKSKDIDTEFVFKISQHIDYLAEHELTVMLELNKISNFCPHFCRVFGGIVCDIDPTKNKEENPFDISKQVVEKEVVLMEHIENSRKFYNYINCNKFPEDILFSIIKQTLLAINIAQKKSKFSHYDLHANNIMVKKCSKDLVFLYVLDDNNQFFVPSYGYYPVIIDFGFSYAISMEGNPLWPSLCHTNAGFMSDRFDPVADPKLFLITVSDEIHDIRKSKKSKILKNITKNIYSKLKVDWESGWDNFTEDCAVDSLTTLLEKDSKISHLFDEYEYYCFDIIQTLIILPLEEQNYDNIHTSYSTFLKEFCKIENEIGSAYYCLYILKKIVDTARDVRLDYSKKETRQQAVDFFKNTIYDYISSVAKFCRPKNIHFEKMLCGLLCFSKDMEGVLYKSMNKIINKRNKIYSKLEVETVTELSAILDINIPSEYEFSEKTQVMVINCVEEKCNIVSLTEGEIKEINQYNSISQGPELYKIISKKTF